ncbi:MAG: hemagglutinin, partial [Leptolyngbyaceae cyanobacterium SM1_3_5]|nr:hemagglutinin [Leptolyngbyaceae cyanobacterium SM1_3_5]
PYDDCQAIDIYGNVSDASTALSLTIDTTPPAKPVLPDLTAATDSGSSNSDNITSDATPTFTGTTETNGRVEVFIDNVSQGFATVTGTSWSYTPSANLSEGNHQITVKSIDRAGNESVLSDPLSFAIDTIAPTVPIDPPDLIAADDTGSSNSDNITRRTTPQFTGTVATDAVKAEVTIRNAIGAIVSTQVVDVTAGNWSYTPATALAAGNYTIAAKAIDSAGNISATSPALSYTIDPSISSPTITTISNDTGVPNDRITRDNTLILNGTAEANSSVEVFLDGTSIGTVAANSTGNWSLNHTATPLADRTYIATATATDAAGNTATSSNATIVVDTAVPNAPIVTSISTDTGASTTDGITSDRTLTINGTAEANSTVEIFQGVTKIGTVTTNASGVWSYDYTGTTLADGTYSFTASAIDQAANTSAPSAPFTVVIDNAAPSKPVIASITNDTATPADGITSDDRLIISGTAEANSSVDVFQGVTRIGTVTADSTGNWSLDYTGTAIAPGSYILTARSTDTAGNPSVSSDPFGLTIDTTPPTVPTAPDMVNADDSGASAIDNITNVLEPEFQGTAEANSTIRLIDDLGNEIGTGTADAAGLWRIKAVPRRKGSQSVKAIAIDKAGNISAASGETTFEIDEVAPAQPAPPDLTIASDTGASNTDNITGDDQPEFAGTAEAGSQNCAV